MTISLNKQILELTKHLPEDSCNDESLYYAAKEFLDEIPNPRNMYKFKSLNPIKVLHILCANALEEREKCGGKIPMIVQMADHNEVRILKICFMISSFYEEAVEKKLSSKEALHYVNSNTKRIITALFEIVNAGSSMGAHYDHQKPTSFC